MVYSGQTKKTTIKVGSKTIPAKWMYNGKIYFLQVPSISSQYIGDGKTITSAKRDAIATIKKYGWKV